MACSSLQLLAWQVVQLPYPLAFLHSPVSESQYIRHQQPDTCAAISSSVRGCLMLVRAALTAGMAQGLVVCGCALHLR